MNRCTMTARSFALFCLACSTLAITSPVQATTISTFTGGDVGEGLDFSSGQVGFTIINNVYAVNVLGPAGFTVQGVTFTDEAGASPNVTITANQSVTGGISFGGSADDIGLAGIMNPIRYSAGAAFPVSNFVTLDYDAIPGRAYRLMLLLSSVGFGGRFEDVTVEGITVADNVLAPNLVGTLVSYDYVATDSVTNVLIASPQFLGTDAGGDRNPVFSGFLLQEIFIVPEPSTLALLGLGVVGLAIKKHRRRTGA